MNNKYNWLDYYEGSQESTRRRLLWTVKLMSFCTEPKLISHNFHFSKYFLYTPIRTFDVFCLQPYSHVKLFKIESVINRQVYRLVYIGDTKFMTFYHPLRHMHGVRV